MKTIEVVAAIIKNENKILATRRGYGDFAGGWEFPGGKMEAGETREQALLREIQEELNIQIAIDHDLMTVEYDYPAFHLTMHCFICSIKSGNLTLMEHSDAKWLNRDELSSVQWLPADIEILEVLKNFMQ